jgi:hypothetical protein
MMGGKVESQGFFGCFWLDDVDDCFFLIFLFKTEETSTSQDV